MKKLQCVGGALSGRVAEMYPMARMWDGISVLTQREFYEKSGRPNLEDKVDVTEFNYDVVRLHSRDMREPLEFLVPRDVGLEEGLRMLFDKARMFDGLMEDHPQLRGRVREKPPLK